MKRNVPFPAGLAIVQNLLRTCPEFGELAAAGGLTAVQVLLKPAPANPTKSKALPHLAAGTVGVLNADAMGLLEAADGKKAEPMFRITCKEDAWAKLTPRGQEAFMYTCLVRFQVVAKEDADSDDTGYTCSVQSFPIQTFDRVLEKYGRWDQTDVMYDEEDSDEDEEDDGGLVAPKTPTAAPSRKLNPDALANGSAD